jgi:hypothetical protein
MNKLSFAPVSLHLSCAVAVVTLLIACGSTSKVDVVAKDVDSGPITYESYPDEKGAFTRLVCGGGSPFIGTCELYSVTKENKVTDAAVKTQFNLHQKYLLDSITSVVSGVSKNSDSVKKSLTAQRDVEAVTSVNPSEANCKADVQMADLLLVCEHRGEKLKTLILFVRGLCDRCNFEPVVLRKNK